MDEDDSQDELINCSTSHKKGKRAALWTISDDSDDSNEESEEGDSDSGEEDDDEAEDGEGGDDDDDEEEEDDEEDAKAEDGAFGGNSADIAGFSSDEDTETCPICLNSFSSQPVATPENCEHYFCFDCILEWAKNVNSCPVDRIAFNNINLRKCYGGKVKKIITVQKPKKADQEEIIYVSLDETNCEVCGGTDREDRLLLCDGCDAGYHMECLTPPLDSVPVEEWFCPECEANNRHSRGSAEELSDTESLPSTARPATSQSQSRAAGPTRAIARTQQSERVRANVNRHRISQARTSQLAPTYLIQSTWLDETINAVVAGLNTAVYVRDVAPRAPSNRRRKTGKRRKVRRKKTPSAKSKNGKVASTGVKRRRRRVRRTQSRKKLMLKKKPTPRSRIANNLGIVKDKKSSSLPTVYQPMEHSLSSMRADIGAASLSIYGDPFDLDPFVDREDEPEAHKISLLEAKRRGISRSALRSHQPVARPVTANLSRRGMVMPQAGAVVEAAPVPDLLGSILSGQSILLMDSSDVVINRDGSLKATKPMPSTVTPSIRKSSSSEDNSTFTNPGTSPNLGDSSISLNYHGNLPGSSHKSVNSLLNQSSSHLPPLIPNHTQPISHSDSPPRGNPSFHSPLPNRRTTSLCQRGTNGVRAPRETTISSPKTVQDSSFKSREMGPSQSQTKKAPAKPMWIDVSELPKIPKIKRESSSVTSDASSQCENCSSKTVFSSGRRGGSNSSSSSSSSGMPETGITSLSGDKGRQQSVDQQKGQANGQTQRHRPEGASSSSAFSNSFSSSSSGTSASQPRYASSSSSSSAVSFRINSSGNSWHARRLNIATSSTSRSTIQEHWREKDDDAKKKRLCKDKQMLLASHTLVSKEQSSNMYDPFNPTLSDSGSSDDDEDKTTNLSSLPHKATDERTDPTLGKEEESESSKHDLVLVKTETQEMEISYEQPGTAKSIVSQELRISGGNVKVEQESRLVDVKPFFFCTKVKEEPKLEDIQQYESCDSSRSYLNLEVPENTPPSHHTLDKIKKERETQEEGGGQCAGSPNRSPLNHSVDSSSSNSANASKRKKETKSDSRSPLTDLDHKKQASKTLKEQRSSSSERERHRREDHHPSGHGGKKKETHKDRSHMRTGSRERRTHSSSDSSQPNSPDRTHRKRRSSRSQSKDTSRRRSRSRSSSSSRDRSSRKKHKQRSSEMVYERRRVSKDKRRGRSRSKSRSKSRSRSRTGSRSRDHKRGALPSKSRSRSRERKKDDNRVQRASLCSKDKLESRTKDKKRHRSRSSSRERRKAPGSSRSAEKTSGTSASTSRDTNRLQERKEEKDTAERVSEEGVCDKINKQELPSCSFAGKIKKEDLDLAAGSQTTTSEITKELKIEKEVGQEKKSCFDMFQESPIVKSLKSEETGTSSSAVSKNTHDVVERPIKTESCEITIIKSEPKSPELCPVPLVSSFSTLNTPVAVDTPQDAVSQSQLVSVDSDKRQNPVGLTVPVKQEPSDSDDDFNVDVMLDDLDFVKSEQTEGSGETIKKEKEVGDCKDEGEQVSSVVGTKAKTQVKRVTWNIQEPEGPQPEKSASKVALYKLRLKQEGARKSSFIGQTSCQHTRNDSNDKKVAPFTRKSKRIDGTSDESETDTTVFSEKMKDSKGDVSDPLKKGATTLLGACSTSDALQSVTLSTAVQGEGEGGDVSKKDKYLKKLHMQERAIEEVKLAIKPFYQRRDINKDEYKEILRKAVQKVCHSKSGEINPVKVGNLVKAYVEKYKHARKHKKGDDSGKVSVEQTEPMKISDMSP